MFHIRHVDGYYQDLTFCICFGKVDMSQSAGYGIGGCVSEMDFRPEGFGIVRIHGPFIFKWEMCVSEEGHRPVEGIMSVFDLPVYDSHLLQTNRQMTISEIFATGVYSLWPANMIQGTCVPNETSLHDRAVIGHIDIHENDLGPASEHSQLGSLIGHDGDDRDSDSQSITSDYLVRDARGVVVGLELHPHVRKMIDPLLGIYDGRNKVDICSVYPLPAKCALGCLRAQDELFNQVAFPRCRLPALPFSTVSNAGCCCSSARHCTSSLFVRPWWNLAREKRRKI